MSDDDEFTGGSRSDEDWSAEKREFMLDERERIAGERDRIADEREQIANERERIADQRARNAGFADAPAGVLQTAALKGRIAATTSRALARQDALAAVDVARAALAESGYVSPLLTQFALLARHLYDAESVEDCLSDIAQYAKHLAQCDAVSVSTVKGQAVSTAASTDALAVTVDDIQYDSGEGPCLQALDELATIVCDDLRSDSRWPTFGPLASDAGILSALSVCMYLEADTTTRFGSLNHYAAEHQAFDAVDTDLSVILAAHAAVALASMQLSEDRAGLQEALQTRDIIGQAKGILMERAKITADQAFDLLRRGSQLLNRRLRDIADDLATTGELPNP